MVRFATALFAFVILSLGLSAQGAEILMLDFWSPQCGPCMQMKPTMHALEQANYPIREVDTTREGQLAQQHNVSSIPCFVMLVDGREVDREVGATSSERLQQMFQKAKDEVVRMRGVRGQSPDPRTVAAGGAAPGVSAVGPAPSLPARPAMGPAAMSPPVAGASVPVGPLGGVSEMTAQAGDFPPNLIAATVRIRVDESQGRSFGTGTIIDSRSGEALIVTCGHLFRESKGKGPMTIEMFEPGPNGLQVAGQVSGQLISYDLDRDVAFVSIKPGRQVGVAAVAPPRTSIQRGDRVATIGCSNGKDPTLLPQRVTMLDRYQGPANIEVSGAPEEGRSGGGLFNLRGQLIGVCYAADYEGKEGLYAALDSVHSELARLGLKDVYAKNGGPAVVNETAATDKAATQEPLIRGQVPLEPLPESVGPPVAGANANPPGGVSMSNSEQAAFGEIMNRTLTSEVVVIVRPKTPGGQSEVITLDNASPEFVKALAERRRAAAPATIGR